MGGGMNGTRLTGNQRIRALNEVNSASQAAGRKESLSKTYGQVSERQLRLQICKMMLYSGWWGGKINTQGTYLKRLKTYIKDRYLLRGVPDLLFFKGDCVVGAEIKVGKNKLSEAQEDFRKHWHRPELKRYCLVIRSWDDMQKFLDREGLS